MRAVNLLPRDHSQTRTRASAPMLVAVCAVVLIVAVLGADFMMQSGKVTKEQQQLDSLQAKVHALPPAPSGPTAGQTQLADEHSARVTALSSALANRVAWDRVFREFSLVLPDDVWLTTLTAHAPVSPGAASAAAPAPTTGAGSTEFVISGNTYSHDGVARLLSRLQVIPDLQNVTLVSSTLTRVGDQTVVAFQITADIRTAIGSPST